MHPEPARPWILRPIRAADDPAVAATIREVMTEHGCSGPGFAIHDAEVQAMSRHYAAADARYYVLEHGGLVLGGGGFARLHGTAADAATCELRKMYFRPAARGLGLGHALLQLLLAEMRGAGYRRCYLETTSRMLAAQHLYRAHGFAPLCSAQGATGHFGCDCFFARDL
ncbi:MAG: GNAT family N-acetyltransferase [Planctomycetes bacterium]|nr:GNAT family N-acetyltransferase [Planctomycetota bacterium]